AARLAGHGGVRSSTWRASRARAGRQLGPADNSTKIEIQFDEFYVPPVWPGLPSPALRASRCTWTFGLTTARPALHGREASRAPAAEPRSSTHCPASCQIVGTFVALARV